jgi:hypothetical protein
VKHRQSLKHRQIDRNARQTQRLMWYTLLGMGLSQPGLRNFASALFWYVISCIPIEVLRRFGGTRTSSLLLQRPVCGQYFPPAARSVRRFLCLLVYPKNGGSMFLQNVGEHGVTSKEIILCTALPLYDLRFSQR